MQIDEVQINQSSGVAAWQAAQIADWHLPCEFEVAE
jgi:hypothetical protein